MTFTFSQSSLDQLKTVDPRLQKVVTRALELSTQDFKVLEGVRSREQMMINYGKGRTAAQLAKWGIPAKYAQPNLAKVTWLNKPFESNHRAGPDGLGRAIDLVPFPVDFNTVSKYESIWVALRKAEAELGIPIRYIGDQDRGHVELK